MTANSNINQNHFALLGQSIKKYFSKMTANSNINQNHFSKMTANSNINQNNWHFGEINQNH